MAHTTTSSRRTMTRGAAGLAVIAVFFIAGYFAFHGASESPSSPANTSEAAEGRAAASEYPYCFLFFRLDSASSAGVRPAAAAVLARFTADACKLEQYPIHSLGFGSSDCALAVAGDGIYLALGDAVLLYSMRGDSAKPLFNPAYKPESLAGQIHFSDAQGQKFFDPRSGKLATADLRLPDSARLSPDGTRLAWIEREPAPLPDKPVPAASWPPSKFRVHLLTIATLKSQVVGEPAAAFEWQPDTPGGTGSRLPPPAPDFDWYDDTHILTVSTYSTPPLQPGFGVQGATIPSTGRKNDVTAIDLATAQATALFPAPPNSDRALFTYVPGTGLVMNPADGAPGSRINLINRCPIDGPIPLGPATASRIVRSTVGSAFGVSELLLDGNAIVPNAGKTVAASVWIAPDGRSLVYSVTDPGGAVLYYLDKSRQPRQIMRVSSFAPAMCRWINVDDLKPIAPATGRI